MWSPLEKLNSGKQLSKFIFQKHGEFLLPKIKNKDLFFTFVFQQNEALVIITKLTSHKKGNFCY